MANARTEFAVVETESAWEIVRDGKEFLAVQSKEVAVDEALVQATRNEPSHVVVKRVDGSVEEVADFGDVPADDSADEAQESAGAVKPLSSNDRDTSSEHQVASGE